MVTISWFVVHEMKSSHRQVIIDNSWFTAVQGYRLISSSLQFRCVVHLYKFNLHKNSSNHGRPNFKQITEFRIILKDYPKRLLPYLSW